MEFDFALLLIGNGILIGLMYSLIALGFVVVYKATDAINFAQGEFVMLAALMSAAVTVSDGTALLGRRVGCASGHDLLQLRPRARSCCARCSAGRSWRSSWRRSGWRRSCAGSDRSSSAPRRDRSRCRWATSPSFSARSSCSRCRSPVQRWRCSFSAASPGSSSRAAWAWRCAPSPTTSRSPWPWESTSSATSRSPGPWPGSSRHWAAWCGAPCWASTCTSRWSA